MPSHENATRACPLCASRKIADMERIDAMALGRMYADFLGKSVGHLFEGSPVLIKKRCERCHLVFFDPPASGDAAFYERLSEKKFYYPTQKDEYEYSLRHIQNAEKVLDIGCGAGEFASMVKNYTGIDINAGAVSKAREKGLRVFWETLEEHIATHPAAYDVICAFQVLEHIIDPRAFIGEMIKGLSEGGRIVLSVPSAESFIALAQNHLLNLPPHHLTWWPDHTLKSVAQRFPLELIDIYHEPVQDIHLDAYVITLYTQILNTLLPFRHYTLRERPGVAERIRNRAAVMLCNKTIGVFKSLRFRPIGHTVTAVFRLKTRPTSKSAER
ncbi:MAG: class I SAM-dependent methyltransferase [Pseudomonadota bacterium]